MKKTGVRQMIFGILGSLACGVSVMGCYPLGAGIFYRTLFRTGKRSCAACFYVHRNDSVYAADRSGKIRGDTDRYDRCSEADRMGK